MTDRYIVDEPLDLNAMLRDTESEEAGAVVTFGGTVRLHHEGREVTHIEYTAYRPLAEKTMAEIERETRARFDITDCRMLHRVGELAIGELSVLVVVRAEHRAEAFEAARYAIDTIKQRVPVWKRETYSDGTHCFVKGTPLHEEGSAS